jgi:pectate lyase
MVIYLYLVAVDLFWTDTRFVLINELHLGEIIQMVFHEKDRLLVTSGKDYFIRISTVNPFSPDIIQVKIEIDTNFLPRVLAVSDNTIVSSGEDAVIYMFRFDIKSKRNVLLMQVGASSAGI